MGFLGLGKPKWKHSDAEVRLRAVADLAEGSQGTFLEIATGDSDPRVRASAATRLRDVPRLVELQKSADPALKRIATERLSGVADQWLRVKPLADCRPFLDHVVDQKSLAELSVQAKDAGVRSAAFAKLVALSEPSAALLALVAIQDAQGDLAAQAVSRIDKRSVLKDVARKAKVESVRTAATARAEALGKQDEGPSPEQLRQARRKALPPLLDQALRLAVSTDWERTAAAWEALAATWAADRDALPLDEETTALDGRFQRARSDFNARREAEAARLAEAVRARELFLAELSGRAPLDPAEAGAHRQELLFRWTSLGDIPAQMLMPLTSRFEAEVSRLHPAPVVEAKPVRVVPPESEAKLLALAEEAEKLAASGGKDAKFRFQELHKEWSRYSADVPPNDARATRFLDAWNAWKTKGRELRETRQEQTESRLAAMKALCVEAEDLATEAEAFGGAPEPAAVEPFAARLKDLQGRWKAIGPVRFELSQPLRERFRAAVDQAYVPVNATRDAADWERFASLTKAEELIARTQALADEQDLGAVIACVKQAHQDWKQLGPLPRDKGQEAWGRFKATCDAQFERAKPYFAEQDALRVANLARKRALLAELESLATAAPIGLAGSPADIQMRRANHERIKSIQAEWKEIGQVPREHDGELWRTYRAVCDAYYDKQREQMSARNAEHGENLTRKLGLIVAVEDLAQQAEGATRQPPAILTEIKRLQAVWKTVGHVPKDQADAIWDKWRTACDRIYATLKPHLEEQEAQRRDNAAKKEALITEVEDLAKQENARWFKDDVREMMEQWRGIGYVPRERMDELNDRFRAACDKILSQ